MFESEAELRAALEAAGATIGEPRRHAVGRIDPMPERPKLTKRQYMIYVEARNGRSYNEIAAILGVARGAAIQATHRVCKRLGVAGGKKELAKLDL